MFGAILKATKSSFQKGMTFCRSIYVNKVMKLLAFIFEQPSYYICKKNKATYGRLYPHLTGKAGKTTALGRSTTTLPRIL